MSRFNLILTPFLTVLLVSGLSPLFGSPIRGAPWGRDAELSIQGCQSTYPHSCSTFGLGPFAESAIAFHQQVISPADGPRSHFFPSSSQYTLEAMRRYGFFQGFFLGCDRLMRENSDPWIYAYTADSAGNALKYDPVK